MDSTTRRLKIQRLKAQLEACRLQNIAFAKEYEASSTTEEKEEIALRWDKAMKEKHFVQRALEILEKETTHC